MHVESAKLVFSKSASSLLKVPSAAHIAPHPEASTAAAFKVAAPFQWSREVSLSDATSAGRNPVRMEEKTAYPWIRPPSRRCPEACRWSRCHKLSKLLVTRISKAPILKSHVAPLLRERENHEFQTFPAPSMFSYWKWNFPTKVCSGSCHPSDAMSWIREIDSAQSREDLKSFLSI